MCRQLHQSTTFSWTRSVRYGGLVLILVLLPFTLSGQNKLVITGSIIDFANLTALEAVNVTIVGTELGDATNHGGIYSIEIDLEKINADSIAVKAEHIGYRTFTTTLRLKSGAVILNIQLQPTVLKAVEMVVIAPRRVAPRAQGYASQFVSAEELASSGAQSWGRALVGKVSGLSLAYDTGLLGSSPIPIWRQGFGKLQLPLIVIDGLPMSYIINDGIPSIGYIGIFEIESIEVVKGPFLSGRYGLRAQNGVILIKTKRGR